MTAAPSGSVINVCPGTYTEQVTIPAGKDNLVLRSVNLWQAIIKAPPAMLTPKAIVRVSGAHNTTLLAFTISGPGDGPCDSIEYGVRVDNTGSANILGNHIVDIRDLSTPDQPISGCQNGVAIQVGRDGTTATPPDVTTGSALILGNVIERYQKNGPTVSNTGSSAYIAGNEIVGVGPTKYIAQNGMQVSDGATATIQYNFVSQNIYTPQTYASTGILFYSAGTVNVSRNTVAHNDVGVYDYLSTAKAGISQNWVQTSTFDGITLEAVSNHTASANLSSRNGGPGISLYGDQAFAGPAVTSNTVDGNQVDHNQGDGILLDDALNNTVRYNHVRANGTSGTTLGLTTAGLHVTDLSAGNGLLSNFMKNNLVYDCEDDTTGTGTAGTANTWSGDRGDTQNRPGLCRPSGDSDDKDDQKKESAVEDNAGWNANYAWYSSTPQATGYNWSATSSAVPTQSLLQLPAATGSTPARPQASAAD